MRDYTSNGVPVANLTTADIHDFLTSELEVADGDGLANPLERVVERLKLELEIRALGLRQ